jgi:tetratricopeptide (TPR) repeat protein
MMEIYRGRLLCDQEHPDWMAQRADLLHRLYLDVVEEYLQKLHQAGRQQEIISICREALDADPTNANMNTRLMDALMHTGRENDAIRQYQHASSLTGTESASTALDEYYTRMLQADKDMQQTLQELREELTKGADTPGALLCDRIVFGELFRMEQRSLERTQSSITLGIAMLRGLDDSPWQLDAAITTLLGVMVNNLRRGDIVTRLNATQAAFLLPYASEADTGTIVDRLKRSFYLQVPSGCSLSFAFTPISIQRNQNR